MRNSRGLTAAAFAVMAAGALVLLSGCISSERAWRNSPAGSGEIRVRFDNQTVNVWPLYYHNDDFTSVLWPLFDLDSRGFAVRPFYCQEGNEASLLWPLSGWDPDGGWALNCVWGDDFFAAIPLFIWSDEIRQFGPVWRTITDKTVIFPIAYWEDSFRSWSFCPAWKIRDDWGVFPVVWVMDDYRVIGPVWWRSSDRPYWGVFPIVWRMDDLHIIGPAWWSGNGDEIGVFPLAGRYGNNFCHIGPVWWQNGNHGAFPLYGWEKRKTGFDFTIGYPLFRIEQSDDESEGHVLWPVVGWDIRRDGSYRSWRIWPLVSYNNNVFQWFSPVLQINTHSFAGDLSESFPNRPYTPFGRSFSLDEESPSRILESTKSWFGTILAFHESGTARVWKSADSRLELEKLANALWHLDRAFQRRSWIEKDTHPEEWKQAETNIAERKQKVAEQLARLDPALPVPENPEELETLTRTILERCCSEVDYFEHRTLGGLTSWYERFGDDYWGLFGLGTVFMRKYRDKSDFRILGYLYREKHDGDSSETLYPLFVNVKEAPGRYRWSFLYRVFSYENDNGRKSGHIFFIPWGDEEERPETTAAEGK
ncbi:hypothetical protein [uncultured Victivallis sp.]|uniref:hypothetical protein n=1 Tax=uncultured Victivallis sp. TaxID=354118 RepID=UPI0025EBAB6B|nr:hypothetical protein [uncultured Victivallis sp.]